MACFIRRDCGHSKKQKPAVFLGTDGVVIAFKRIWMTQMKSPLRHMKSLMRNILQNEKGSVTAYVAVFATLGLGLGALSIDMGRATVLKTQMQNRADAGAMAGAAQLDGRDGARARATEVAINAMQHRTLLAADEPVLAVESVAFYSEVSPALVVADSDETAKFISVTMEPRSLTYIFKPILSGNYSETTTMEAEALAHPDPYMCHAPPLMICDLGENDATIDLNSEDVIGRQIVLKPPQGGDDWAPGNYGLLALPDGSIGASALEEALAAVVPQDCYGLELGTAPGVKTNKVQNGINARFEYETSWPYPAPNVINYPQDEDVIDGSATKMGNGQWDLATYWADKHATALPTDLVDATRYQVYLYELGKTFGRNGTSTYYPVDESMPIEYTEVTPPAVAVPTSVDHPDNPDYDGVPDGTVASNEEERRLVKVAILQCVAEGVRGSHNYPSSGKYLEMFVTQSVPNAPAGAIYAEVVRPLTLTVTPDFHANVKLVK